MAQTAPLYLLEPLTDNELGKDLAAAPAHDNDIDFDLEELGAEDGISSEYGSVVCRP